MDLLYLATGTATADAYIVGMTRALVQGTFNQCCDTRVRLSALLLLEGTRVMVT